MGTLALVSPGAWRCPDGEALAAFLDHRLSGSQQERLEEHLAACAGCRELVAGATWLAQRCDRCLRTAARDRAFAVPIVIC